ncbi:tetratricopeptide repeat protein [Bradymonadaceae bacterium TMQ3]|nr:tetratricopeptide repeat protein [Bradymonadaceae bacterium TMQ3]TXC76753.1 tetratricopeptide repeat protein [Bradymonadales bacterium TMQ1]
MSSPRHPIAALCTLLAFSMLATSAFAQDEPTADELAQQYFDEGASFFIEGNYARAILSFRRAFDQRPDPMILYNMSLAHSRLGNHREAYETTLATQSMEGLPEQAKVRVDARADALFVVVNAEELAPRIAAITAAEKSAERTSAQSSQPGLSIAPPLDLVRQPEGMGLVGWAGVGTTVVGAGLLTGALLVDRSLASDIEAYQQASDQGRLSDYNELRADIESRANTGKILLYSGAGAAALGLGMWIFGVTSAADSNIDVAFAPDGSSGLVRFSTTF